jgi:hypothetical protein
MATIKSSLKTISEYPKHVTGKRGREPAKIKINEVKLDDIHEYNPNEEDDNINTMVNDISHIKTTLDIFFKKKIGYVITDAGLNGRTIREPGKEDDFNMNDAYRNIQRILKPLIQAEFAHFHTIYTKNISSTEFRALSTEHQNTYKTSMEAKFKDIQLKYNLSTYTTEIVNMFIKYAEYTCGQLLQVSFKASSENRSSIMRHFMYVLMHLGLPDLIKFKNQCNNKCHIVAEYITSENPDEILSDVTKQRLLIECRTLVNLIKESLHIQDVSKFDQFLHEVANSRCSFLKNTEFTPEHFALMKENARRAKETRAASKRAAASAASSANA